MSIISVLIPFFSSYSQTKDHDIIKTDTITIRQYLGIEIKTNDGSDCFCLLKNDDLYNDAIIAIIGVSENMKFYSLKEKIEGINSIRAGGHKVFFGNFKGAIITILNISTKKDTIVLVAFYCK